MSSLGSDVSPRGNAPLSVACASAVKFPGVLLPPSFTHEKVVELMMSKGESQKGEISILALCACVCLTTRLSDCLH